jgi:hypothetical protein
MRAERVSMQGKLPSGAQPKTVDFAQGNVHEKVGTHMGTTERANLAIGETRSLQLQIGQAVNSAA